MAIAVTILSRVRSRRVMKRQNNKDRASSSGTICRIDIGGIGMLGGTNVKPVVETVTTDVTGVTPSAGVTGVVGRHVTGITAPVHVSATAWLKPLSGVIVTLKLAVFPLCTVKVAGAVRVKSQPVPVNGTVCVPVPALSVTVRDPVRAPSAVGANVTLMTQFAPDAKVAGLIGHAVPPVLVSAKSPEAAIELMVNAPVPVFVSVTIFAALVVVSNWPPKLRLVGASLTPGAVADPVPLRFTICGLEESLSVKVSVPVREAAAPGLNVTATVHGAPAATLGLHESVATAKSVLAAGDTPAVAMLVNVTATFVLFVSVNICGLLVAPTGWAPKSNGEGVTTTVGISVSLATNAAETSPLGRLVWNAPGFGNTGKFVENVVPET